MTTLATDEALPSRRGDPHEPGATASGSISAPEPEAQRALPAWLRIGAAQLAIIVVAIGIWHLGTVPSSNAILSRLGPADAFSALVEQVQDGTALAGVVASLRRLALGLIIAAALGIPLGVALGTRDSVSRATGPLVQFLRMLSPLAWAPAAVAVFGIGDAPVTFLVAAATVWPLLLGTAAGVRAVDPEWSLVARSLGATTSERLRTVIFPAIKAPVLTALRLALGVGWVVLVPAEMLGVDSGLGYAVLNARDQLAYDHLAATMLLIGLVGFVIDTVFQRVLQPAQPA